MLSVITSKHQGGSANLLSCSNNFASTAWELYNGAGASNNGDGTWTLTLPGGGTAVPNAIDQQITWAPSTTYTFSINAKLGAIGTKFRFLFNPGNTGSNGSNQFSIDHTITSTLTRYSTTFTTPSTLGNGGNTPNICLVPDAAGDAVTFIASQALLVLGSSVGTYGSDTGCPGLSAPSQASAWGMNTLTFSDDFTSTSTIDTSKTFASGFNWYLTNPFSGGQPSLGDISVSNSILTISNDASGYNMTLISACSLTVGTAFSHVGGGFYVEYRKRWNPSGFTGSGSESFPATWMMSRDHLFGSVNSNFPELDLIEAYPTGAGSDEVLMAFHDWSSASSDIYASNFLPTMPSGFDSTQFNIFGTLYVPMSKNGGTGIVQRYVNNTFLTGTTVNFTAGGLASPGVSNGSNFNGAFSDIDSHTQPLILGAGPDCHADWDWVRVWQVSAG